ncbi:ISNCY family transposase [archaeon]|jgi:transposase|nr:ISNCY family transposase [archaeon]
MTTEKAVKFKLRQLDMYLLKEYKEKFGIKHKNSKDYENRFSKKIRLAIKNLNSLITESVKTLTVDNKTGRPSKLSLKQKVTLILMQQLIGKSNRMMENLLDLFSVFFDIDISYKTIERLYGDDEVKLALLNLFELTIKKKGISEIDASGDATGYGLTIKIHYQSYASKLKEKSKMADGKKKKFVYKFAMMDLDSKMYVCYGTSLKSEKDAYFKAITMLRKSTNSIWIKSMRLDRYYSNPGDVNSYRGCDFYFIPKKNLTMGNGIYWNERLTEFVKDTFGYLKEYYRRNNSESCFSVDKKLLGWRIGQKRDDRIDTVCFCKTIWRNLFQLYA